MKYEILFTTGCLSNKNTGTYHSLLQTVESFQQLGHKVSVVGTNHRAQNMRNYRYLGCSSYSFRRFGPGSLHFAPKVKKWLSTGDKNWQIISMQGVWVHLNSYVADWCIKNKRPFMLTPHGSFNEYALAISSWKKKLADITFMKKVYKNVSCYQALTDSEYIYLRERGITQPICTIANGIKIPEIQSMPLIENILPENFLKRSTCLYIGRLAPIKGLERLIKAWRSLGKINADWQLVIAGSGDADYERKLKGLAGCDNNTNIFFVGSVHDDLKSAWLRQADFLVLPSFSEAFPMAILEGLSYQKPCLLTSSCGLPQVSKYSAGVEVSSNEKGITEGLQHILSLSSSSLRTMGENGLSLIKLKYQWSHIANELEQVYDWLTGCGEKPTCVQTV